jgi:uncharacterized protein
MQALSERFEMRLGGETLQAIDGWRARQSDVPSRAEAMRRLVERGLRTPEAELQFSRSEILITHLLCDLSKSLKVKSEIDPVLVQSALLGGHFWAIDWEYSGLFPDRVDSREVRNEVVDFLDMWTFVEEAYEKLGAADKAKLKEDAAPFGKNPRWPGFDGNNESEHLGVARVLTRELKRFERIGERGIVNSHHPTLDTYRRMYQVFEPMRARLAGGNLSLGQLTEILKAQLHPLRRKEE